MKANWEYLGETNVSHEEEFLNMTKLDFVWKFIELEIGWLGPKERADINSKITRILPKVEDKEWFLKQLKDILVRFSYRDSIVESISRILDGDKVTVTKATWVDGRSEYRFRLETIQK